MNSSDPCPRAPRRRAGLAFGLHATRALPSSRPRKGRRRPRRRCNSRAISSMPRGPAHAFDSVMPSVMQQAFASFLQQNPDLQKPLVETLNALRSAATSRSASRKSSTSWRRPMPAISPKPSSRSFSLLPLGDRQETRRPSLPSRARGELRAGARMGREDLGTRFIARVA